MDACARNAGADDCQARLVAALLPPAARMSVPRSKCLGGQGRNDPISLLSGWSVMRGEYRHQEGARLTSLVLDPASGTATQATVGDRESEFPSVAGGDVGQRYEHVLCVERRAERSADVPGFDQIAVVDIESGAAERFSYGDGWLVEEHLFVGTPDDAAPRWVAGTALDTRADNTVFSVFDAE